MANHVDETIQEANALTGIMAKYSSSLDEAGFDAAQRTAFQQALDDTIAKDTAQKNAVETLRQKTEGQNTAMNAALDLIRSAQNAARAAFGPANTTAMKEFHVGNDKITTVKGMMTELAYITGVATAHQTDLAKNGFSADNVAALETALKNLTTADTEQENAKKAQMTATDQRDTSAKGLHDLIIKVRNIAKAKFRNDADILNEFSSITVHRGPAKDETVQPTVQKTSPA